MDGIPHFMISSAIALALAPFIGWWSLLALVGGWAVDFDHYLFYIGYFRKLDPFEALRYFKGEERVVTTFCFFHNIEVIILLSFISFFSLPVLVATIALIIHVFCDIAYDTFVRKMEHERFSILMYTFL